MRKTREPTAKKTRRRLFRVKGRGRRAEKTTFADDDATQNEKGERERKRKGETETGQSLTIVFRSQSAVAILRTVSLETALKPR